MCDYGWDGYNVGIQLREERRRKMAEVEKSPIKTTDVNKDTKEVLGDQQTKSKTDPKGDVTAERTEKQVVRGTIHPDKEG